jgi:hypothetical protein
MRRLGAAKGTGSGYRNLANYPRDPMVHKMSARGMKQVQRIVTIPLIRQKKEEPNEIAVRELLLFTENDGELYRQMRLPLLKRLEYSKRKGVYNKERAIQWFLNVINVSAKKYNKEFASPNDKIFTMADKREVARQMTEKFETEYALGNRVAQ